MVINSNIDFQVNFVSSKMSTRISFASITDRFDN